MEEKEVRLQKFLANQGGASRRKSEELILQGKVKVNGKVITELGTKVNTDKDKIEYNGKAINKISNKVYVLLNKPIGYVTTVKDQFDRDTVMDLIKGVSEKVVPVGRLDMYTSGALLLSNDGEFINKITHPSNEINKTYNATIRGKITSEDVKLLTEGVEIVDKETTYITKKALVKILKIDEEKNISRVQITIHEGKNREVRKMFQSINKKVIALHRAKIGELSVKNIKIGQWKYLTKGDLDRIYK